MIFDFISGLITPKEKKFYPLFEKASANLIQISKVFQEFIHTEGTKQQELFKEIERLEQVGDEVTIETYHEVLATFLTPLDREDIHALITAIDDIVDAIYGSSKRIMLYKISPDLPNIHKHAEILLRISQDIHQLMLELRTLKDREKIKKLIINLKEAEFESDNSYEHAISELFDNETHVGTIFKIREIYSYLEKSVDYVEDVAIVFETILAKNA
jgi:uncharacterized protein Yka (UPF0111/DUF47 family)